MGSLPLSVFSFLRLCGEWVCLSFCLTVGLSVHFLLHFDVDGELNELRILLGRLLELLLREVVVSVTSKCNEDGTQHVWESSADASFTVVPDPRGNTLGRGSRVTLHLKEDAHDYLSEEKLKESAKKYSQFIQFPIYVKVKKEVDAEADEDDEDG